MKTNAETRMSGMQALIGALGLVEVERFVAAISRDRFNYTEWRRHGLPTLSIEQVAQAANEFSNRVGTENKS